MDGERCPHCGGAQLVELGNYRYKCEYCGATCRKHTNAPIHNKVQVVIKKGANVHIKSSGKLVLKDTVGSFTVEDGANLQIDGVLEIEEPGDPTKKKRS